MEWRDQGISEHTRRHGETIGGLSRFFYAMNAGRHAGIVRGGQPAADRANSAAGAQLGCLMAAHVGRPSVLLLSSPWRSRAALGVNDKDGLAGLNA